MQNVRRWYIYLVSAISLLAVVWAFIGMLQLFFADRVGDGNFGFAFNTAVIVIGLPVYLAHWLSAQRAARAQQEERRDFVRRLFIYSILAISLWSILTELTSILVGPAQPTLFYGYDHHLISLFVMGLVGFYHYKILSEDTASAPETGELANIRRVFLFGFSGLGLFNLTTGARNLISWMLSLLSGETIGNSFSGYSEVVTLVLGLATWLFFWRLAERLFDSGKEEEQSASVRSVYLYLVLIVAAINVIGGIITLLAGLFRGLLALPVSEGWAGTVAIIVVMGVAWFYHAAVLRRDVATVSDVARGERVRQIYVYLIAALGLTVLLAGLVGDLYVVLDGSAGQTFSSTGLLEEFSWFTAALLVGLPLWLLTWRAIQIQASGTSAVASERRRSLPRKVYLYVFLFGASMVLLGSLINIVYQFLLRVLGSGFSSANGDFSRSFSLAIVSSLVLVYYNSILRKDGKAETQELNKKIAKSRVAILETGKVGLGRALEEALGAEYPQLHIDLLDFGVKKSAAGQKQAVAILKKASLVISPWNIFVSKSVPASVSSALVASPAQKLMLPQSDSGWHWVGMEDFGHERMIETSIKAVKQVVAGEPVKYSRGNGCGTIGVVLIVALIILPLLSLLFAVNTWF